VGQVEGYTRLECPLQIMRISNVSVIQGAVDDVLIVEYLLTTGHA